MGSCTWFLSEGAQSFTNNYDSEPLALILTPFVSVICPLNTTTQVGACLGRQTVEDIVRYIESAILNIEITTSDSYSAALKIVEK